MTPVVHGQGWRLQPTTALIGAIVALHGITALLVVAQWQHAREAVIVAWLLSFPIGALGSARFVAGRWRAGCTAACIVLVAKVIGWVGVLGLLTLLRGGDLPGCSVHWTWAGGYNDWVCNANVLVVTRFPDVAVQTVRGAPMTLLFTFVLTVVLHGPIARVGRQYRVAA